MGGYRKFLGHKYMSLYIGNVLVGGCEVNLYALTPQVFFQWSKVSVHEFSVNVKTVRMVDVIDIF